MKTLAERSLLWFGCPSLGCNAGGRRYIKSLLAIEHLRLRVTFEVFLPVQFGIRSKYMIRPRF